MWWRILEYAIILVMIVLIITQVIIPPLTGKKLFWWFRHSEKRLKRKEDELADLNTEEEIVEVQEEIDKKKETLNARLIGGVEKEKTEGGEKKENQH